MENYSHQVMEKSGRKLRNASKDATGYDIVDVISFERLIDIGEKQVSETHISNIMVDGKERALHLVNGELVIDKNQDNAKPKKKKPVPKYDFPPMPEEKDIYVMTVPEYTNYLSDIVKSFGIQHRELYAIRDTFVAKINDYFKDNGFDLKVCNYTHCTVNEYVIRGLGIEIYIEIRFKKFKGINVFNGFKSKAIEFYFTSRSVKFDMRNDVPLCIEERESYEDKYVKKYESFTMNELFKNIDDTIYKYVSALNDPFLKPPIDTLTNIYWMKLNKLGYLRDRTKAVCTELDILELKKILPSDWMKHIDANTRFESLKSEAYLENKIKQLFPDIYNKCLVFKAYKPH